MSTSPGNAITLSRPAHPAETPFYYSILACVIIAGSAYRFYGIDRLGLWSDELWGVMACSKGSWWAMIQDLVYRDNHPPGYQTLLYYTMQLFGSSDLAVRMPSVLAGITLITVTFEFGRRYFSVLAGLIAATLVSGSYRLIYYSHEARAYSLLALLSTLQLYFFVALFLQGDRSRRTLALTISTAIITAYLHYAGMIFVGCEGLIALFLTSRQGGRQAWILFLKVFGPVVIAYLPWLPAMYIHMTQPADQWVAIPDSHSLPATLRFLFGPDFPVLLLVEASLLGGIANLAYTLPRTYRLASQQRIWLCVLFMGLMPIAISFVKSVLTHPIYTNRHFLHAIPLLSLACGHLTATLLQRITRFPARITVVIALIAAITGLQANSNRKIYTTNYGLEEYREIAQLVAGDKSFLTRHHAIISMNEFFDHYLKRFGIQEKSDRYFPRPEDMPGVISELAQNKAEVFYFLEVKPTSRAHESAQMALLRQHYQLICSTELKFSRASLFLNSPPTDTTATIPVCP